MAIDVGVDKVLCGSGVAGQRGAEFSPIPRPVEVQKNEGEVSNIGMSPTQSQRLIRPSWLSAQLSHSYRAMPGNPLRQDRWLFALHGDSLPLQLSLLRFAAEFILARGQVHALHVVIHHVEMQIRNAPGDALVVADNHHRNARQRDAHHVQARRLQMDLIPGGREAEL